MTTRSPAASLLSGLFCVLLAGCGDGSSPGRYGSSGTSGSGTGVAAWGGSGGMFGGSSGGTPTGSGGSQTLGGSGGELNGGRGGESTGSAAGAAAGTGCADQSRDHVVAKVRTVFNQCADGECIEQILITAAEPSDPAGSSCDRVTFSAFPTIVFTGPDWLFGEPLGGPVRVNHGTLTSLGHARARELALELDGTDLQETYGCPDCADGGALGFVLVRGGSATAHTYEYFHPPKLLEPVDAFAKSLMLALHDCASNELVAVAGDCTQEGE